MDITFQTNYWLGFPESNSDILLNLTHWQYWWWFWFTYLLWLYYFFFLRLLKNRLLKFRPKIVTAYKARGKWGDFLVCLLPVTWCINILSNSNFILRMLEWQTESSLFTIRIRGKQWYWVYKIELKALVTMDKLLKNFGHNYWILFSSPKLNYLQDYSTMLFVKNNKDFIQTYSLENNGINSLKKNTFGLNIKSDKFYVTKKINPFKNLNFKNLNNLNNYININKNIFLKNFKKPTNINNSFLLNNLNLQSNNKLFEVSNLNSFKYNYIERALRYNYFSKIRSLKINFFKKQFNVNFINNNNNIFTDKNIENLYLVIKQKRLVPLNKNKFTNKPSLLLKNNSYFTIFANVNHKIDYVDYFKFSKNKPQNFSNMYYRRLLRTKRILVLPTNVNITLITNSFDVVHSWYIPGLGIKLDCVPGRSTHHTINIDHAGFYYGQCAEICGRYHHHMPIRVCALPFEHFLVWWYHFGIPYFNSISTTRKKSIKSGIRQYNW